MKAKLLSRLDDPKLARLLLQVGLVAVFAYAAIDSLNKPAVWAFYMPAFLTSRFSPTALVKFFAVYEIILALWLFSGKYLRWAGLLCALTFGGIVLFNLSQLITTFRDIGLGFMALALAVLAG